MPSDQRERYYNSRIIRVRKQLIEKSTRQFNAHSKSLSDVYQWTDKWCETSGLSKSIQDALKLAVYEAACNVLEHGYKNVETTEGLSVTLISSSKAVTALLEDHGRSFDINKVPPPEFSENIEDRKIGGLGVHFIRTLMDRVLTLKKKNINRLVMIKYLSPLFQPCR